jgi:sulfopyruvate decarboxylase TPP-binding subunit
LAEKNTPLTAVRTIEELKKCGITHVICLPDSSTRVLHNTIRDRGEFTLVPVCREGEAIAVAEGLLLGGKQPLVLHQNTGFFESGDSIRGMGLDLSMPVLMMIAYRGWQQGAPMTDSAGIFIEPILDTWGITHYLMESDEDADKISIAFEEAQQNRTPVVILIGKEYS